MISLKEQTSLSFDDVVDFAKKHVCNIKKRLYRNIYDFNVYMLEKVIETSGVKILPDYYYHTNSEGGGPGGGCQENARNFSTLNLTSPYRALPRHSIVVRYDPSFSRPARRAAMTSSKH